MDVIRKEEPRINEFKIDNFSRPFKKRHKNIKSVQLKVINLDDECKKDIDRGENDARDYASPTMEIVL